jgi:hypothetical protein
VLTLLLAIGASVLADGIQSDDPSVIRRGEIIMAVGFLVVLAAVVTFFRHTNYFKNAYLRIKRPESDVVSKKLIPPGDSTCPNCNVNVKHVAHLFRVEVVNEYACAINRVRLYCDFRDDAAYYLRMRHDNSYKRSDVGELLGPDELVVFDLASVVSPVRCGGCGDVLPGWINFEFADRTLPDMFRKPIQVDESLEAELSATGLEPSGHAIAATKSTVRLTFLLNDSTLELS